MLRRKLIGHPIVFLDAALPGVLTSAIALSSGALGAFLASLIPGLSKYQNLWSCSSFLHRCYANLLRIVPIFIYLCWRKPIIGPHFYHQILVTHEDHWMPHPVTYICEVLFPICWWLPALILFSRIFFTVHN